MNPFEKALQRLLGDPAQPGPTQHKARMPGNERTTNPATLSYVNRAITPAAEQSHTLRELYRSPVADSLYQLFAPSKLDAITPNDPRKSRSVGYFAPMSGTIALDPAANVHETNSATGKSSARETLVHEIGHGVPSPKDFPKSTPAPVLSGYMDSRSVGLLENLRNTMPDYVQKHPKGHYVINKAISQAADKINPYYRTDPWEARAEAFNNAFTFLQETAGNPNMDYRKRAGELEANTPGMGMFVRDLLKHPLYQRHPLRGKIFTQ